MKDRFAWSLFYCLLLWLFPMVLQGGTENFRFRRFAVEDGVSFNSVRALLQDRRGFLWFGTDEGLTCYDGSTVRIYRHNAADPRTIGSNYVSALYEDDRGLWIGTDVGLYLYHGETESFAPFHVATAAGDTIRTSVTNILQDRDSLYWFSTYGQGVFRYDVARRELCRYDIAGAGGLIPWVYANSENTIWALSNDSHFPVYRLNKATDSFEPFPLRYDGVPIDSHSLVIFEDSSRQLWLGTWNGGVQKINRYTGLVTPYLHPASGEGVRHIHSIMEYAPNKLLLGSDDGLSLFDTSTFEHRLFTYDETDPASLSNRFVYPIVKDREGGIWIGTYYGGINYLPPNPGQFDGYACSSYANSVGGNIIGRFCEDAHGNIWIASDDGGLSCWLPGEGRFVNYMPRQGTNSLSYHNVHALCLDGDDLWIGTYTGGLNVLNTRTGVFRHYANMEGDTTSLDGSSLYAAFKDREGRMWVASMSGVNLYNRREDNFVRVRDLGVLTIDIDQDAEGNLWFSTQGRGLFRYDPGTEEWKNYRHDVGDSASLVSDQVNCTLADVAGGLWVGTMEGLCRYNPAEDNFEAVPLDIPSRNICGIVEDRHVLWLTTTKGLVCYTPGGGCQVFNKSDGLQCDQFLPNAVLKASDGKIYVGSVNGFNAFYPFRIRPNRVVPPVVLTRLEIFNKEITVGSKQLPRSLDHLDRLELSYKDNVFSIRYAALSYCIPEKNRYAYRLEGFDKDWNYVGSQTKATYTNIPPGTYSFRVKAANNDGVWNEEGAILKILIRPPFYLSPAFKILYVLLIAVVFALLIRFILGRSEKKHLAEIERLNANREKEVHEAKIKFFTMIAHEIRTPVSLIIGPLEKIMTSSAVLPVPVSDDLNIIERNSRRLLYLVDQLLDFRKVEEEGMSMHFAVRSVGSLLRAVGERFRPFLLQRGTCLRIEYPEPDFTAVIDGEALTKVISNLLSNAGKYTRDEVVLSAGIVQGQPNFFICVTDNGAGITPEEQKKIFTPFYQAADNKPGTGIGLSIVKGIVEAHHGFIEVTSVPGEGSSFIVTLPLEQPDGATVEQGTGLPGTDQPNDILSESPVAASAGKNPLMLIVDDNEEMLSFLSACFSPRYAVLTAGNGKQALQLLKAHEVSLIISDWMMPVMDGVAFCKAVRANQLTSHIPFILLTAKTDVTSKVQGMDCGADAYIEKPFSMQYLEACIKNLLDLRELLRQKFCRMPFVPINSMAGNSADEQFLSRLNELIEQNFSNPELSVDFLAGKLCISRSGLFAKIKSLANVTPNELIQVVRLKKAAALLKEKKYRINEVSYMVGFNNPSYFTKCFQKQFGVKPGEFV